MIRFATLESETYRMRDVENFCSFYFCYRYVRQPAIAHRFTLIVESEIYASSKFSGQKPFYAIVNLLEVSEHFG